MRQRLVPPVTCVCSENERFMSEGEYCKRSFAYSGRRGLNMLCVRIRSDKGVVALSRKAHQIIGLAKQPMLTASEFITNHRAYDCTVG